MSAAAAAKGQRPLLSPNAGGMVHLTLARDRVRALRAGAPWLYAESLAALPAARPGALALVKTRGGDIVAKGMYDPTSPIAFRAVAVKERRLDDALIAARLERAVALRERLFLSAAGSPRAAGGAPLAAGAGVTDGYRLINGEGDALPGLVVDVYRSTAVVRLDGAGPAGFYDAAGVAAWLAGRLPALERVWLKHRGGGGGGGGDASSSSGNKGDGSSSSTSSSNKGGGSSSSSSSSKGGGGGGKKKGELLWGGPAPSAPVPFTENGVSFTADVVAGQKTGFFLDQRDNRLRLARHARGARALNLFSYTGGFSVYMGAAGGARDVTSVDLAAPACAAAEAHWAANGLPAAAHRAVAADAFEFLDGAAAARERWDVVVVDPPSFAPSKASVPQAVAAYERLFAKAAAVTAPGGTLALSSCSSHIDAAMFDQVCGAALARARRGGAAVLSVAGQPEDHPFPLACPELRYLKFTLLALD